MTEIIKLDGNMRTNFGSSSAKKLRKNDRLPAVIYGGKDFENIYIDIDIKKFEKEYLKGSVKTKIFEIKTENDMLELLCYQIDLDPVSDRPRHVDFVSIKNKKEVKVSVPLKFINFEKSPGIKKGGYLNAIVRKLEVICDPKNIPNVIEIDCGTMRLKQSIKISDLKLPNGIKTASKKDLMLVRIIGRGKDDAEDTTVASTTVATASNTAANEPTTAKK